MKHMTAILETIAYMHKRQELCDVAGRCLQTRTMMRPSAIREVIEEILKQGWATVDDGYIFLTEEGWQQYHKDRPRPVNPELLLVHGEAKED